MEQDRKSDYILAASNGKSSLHPALQKFYDAFKDKPPGEFIWGFGTGVDNLSFGPITITVDNVRVSTVFTSDYEEATVKNLKFTVIQGYAQAVFFDRFYASCVMIGKASTVDAGTIASVVAYLDMPIKDREQLEISRIQKAKIDPSFYTQIHNDPINEARNTNGIYIIDDPSNISFETVFQAVGIADFADNKALGLAIAVSGNINTFTNAMTFTVGANMRLASSKRFTATGEIGLLNGKLNAIGLSVKSKIPISPAVSIIQLSCNIKGFQEPKIAVGLGGGLAIGTEITVPKGLGTLQKALFPNKDSFTPLELTVRGEMNPAHNYFSLSGEGKLFGVISVSASFAYDEGNIKAEVKAGLVRNSFLNGSLSAAFNMKQDNWNLRCNFNCSVSVDIWNLVGISVKGELDVLLNSQDYTFANKRYNRKDLTITVDGMATLKLLFSFSVSVQKTWVFNLSNTQLASADLLRSSLSAGDMSALDNAGDVMVCESKDIVENQLPQLRVSSDVIETKSWQIDEQCSKSGLVKIQVAAEYTLVDSNWRLTHSDGNTVTVYTAENAGNTVSVQSFTHNYYELRLDTPEAGNWTLEILGDSKNSGGIYLDALQDEKFVTELEILEQTDSVIRFRYSAITGATDDTTVVRLLAEEISTVPGYDPYSGIIAYLEETENGEFIWEIPEEFRHNANYRFYISAASSNAGSVTESNCVEVFLARQNAELDCSWELAYNADNTDTVTAYITVTNTGASSTAFQWQILDCTNNDSIEADEECFGNTFDITDVIASGNCVEIKGNSSVTFEHVLTVTDELRDNPSSLYLSVTKYAENDVPDENSGTENDSKNYADDTDAIMFTAMESENCRKQTISWQAVDGAVSYILHYALEGDWETGGVYINNIYDTSYALSITPGEYSYRVIAIGDDGKAIGSWSEEQEIDVLFHDEQVIHISENISSARTQVFSLNDGFYNLNGIDLQNFTGSLTLYRNDLIKTGEDNDSTTFTQFENNILTLTVVNGILKNPISEILLDHGDYFWEWTRSENISSTYDITLELSGEVFSMEQQDREIISIGDDIDEMPLIAGAYTETLDGEVGFCNKDAIYQYMTDDGGELSLTIRSGTVFDAKLEINIYVQNSADGDFDCVKTLTVMAGEYTQDTVILDQLVIKNNFNVQVSSWDDGKGEYNTDYSFDLSFDIFEDSVQTTDILEINGKAIQDWIGYRNEAHTYLLQIDTPDRYALRLHGDTADATLKICQVNGVVIEEKQIGSDGTAYLDDIYLESGNYFVVVDSTDKGEGYFNTDYVLSAYDLKTLYPAIDNGDDTMEKASLLDSAEFDAELENWLGTGDNSDFFKFTLSPESELNSSFLLTFDGKTAEEIKNGVLEITCCDEWGQNLAVEELNSTQWGIKTYSSNTEIYVGVSLNQPVKNLDYSFKVSMTVVPKNLTVSAEGLSWDAIPGISGYIAEYSSDNFASSMYIETASDKIDFFALPAGNWQWRVKAAGGIIFSDSEEIISAGSAAAEELVSVANGNTDIFFGNADGVWSVGFAAGHHILGEQVKLAGMNRISAVFKGSDDANILILTDDSNGDALFIDDIYTVNGQQIRLTQIDEIRAGAGNDIVDMTSTRYEYLGTGVTVYGGLGDDTIWANNGSNILFGDAGNDRIAGGSGDDIISGGSGNDTMNGCGGDDIFAFGGNWGEDIVEQFSGGTVTLWFENGSESNWDAGNFTYTDGNNSVKVIGVNTVILKFGIDSSLPEKVFADTASEKIFEEQDKGTLSTTH